jgi:hypothetical protein
VLSASLEDLILALYLSFLLAALASLNCLLSEWISCGPTALHGPHPNYHHHNSCCRCLPGDVLAQTCPEQTNTTHGFGISFAHPIPRISVRFIIKDIGSCWLVFMWIPLQSLARTRETPITSTPQPSCGWRRKLSNLILAWPLKSLVIMKPLKWLMGVIWGESLLLHVAYGLQRAYKS